MDAVLSRIYAELEYHANAMVENRNYADRAATRARLIRDLAEAAAILENRPVPARVDTRTQRLNNGATNRL